jgi:hypothetical protein
MHGKGKARQPHIETTGQAVSTAKSESHESSGFHKLQCTPRAKIPPL